MTGPEQDRELLQANCGGSPLELTALELALLELLMSAPGWLISRERILTNVWGTNKASWSNIVDVNIHRLRNLIDLDAPATPHPNGVWEGNCLERLPPPLCACAMSAWRL